MTSFSARLAAEREEGWRYVDYDRLKAMCEHLGEEEYHGDKQAAHGFTEEVAEELEEVRSFLEVNELRVLEEVRAAKRDLILAQEWIESGYTDVEVQLDAVHKRLTQLGVEVAKLLKWLDINVTAVRRLGKTYDRQLGYLGGTLNLASSGGSLDAFSDPYKLSQLVLQIQQSLDKVHFLRELNQHRGMGAGEKHDDSNWVRPQRRHVKFETPPASDTPLVRHPDEAVALHSIPPPIDEWGERSKSFEQFLSRQLLVSKKTHHRVATEGDIWISRNWEKKGFASRREAETRWLNRVNLQLLGIMGLVFVYQSNLYSLVPFNVFVAETTRKPLYTGAVCFSMQYFFSWAFLFTLTGSWMDKSFSFTLLVIFAAMALANSVYCATFSPSVRHYTEQEIAYVDRSSIGNVTLFVAYGALGIGAILGRVLPSTLCARKALAYTRQGEVVAASMVLADLFGEIFGRSLQACATSISLGSLLLLRDVFTANSVTLPALFFALLWVLLIVLVAVSRYCWHYPPKFSRAEKKSLKPQMVSSSDTWSTAPPRVPMENQRKSRMNWLLGLAVEVDAQVVQTCVQASFALCAQMIFSFEWTWISMFMVFLVLLKPVSFYFAYYASSTRGPKTALCLGFLAVFLSSVVLLPFSMLDSFYTETRFLLGNALLFAAGVVLEAVASSQLCNALEDYQDAAPLFDYYGLVGPVLAVETAKYLGGFLSLILLGLALYLEGDDPTMVLNIVHGFVAVTQIPLIVAACRS